MHTRMPPSGKVRRMIDKMALCNAPYVIMSIACFFIFLTLYVAFFYIQLFTQQHHLSTPEFAPYTVTLLNVGSVFGRVLPNAIADKVGSLNVVLVFALATSATLLSWYGLVNLAGVVVFTLLYGMFSGAIVSLLPSVIMTLTPDLSRVGTRMGMTFILTGIAILTGTPLAGAILGGFSEEEWKAVIGFGAACSLVATGWFSLSRYLVWSANGKLKV